jgi:microcystin-dependent protein
LKGGNDTTVFTINNNSLSPQTDNSTDVGGSSGRVRAVWTVTLNSGASNTYVVANGLTYEFANWTFTCGTDGAANLGYSGSRWKEDFTQKVNASGDAAIGGNLMVKGATLMPVGAVIFIAAEYPPPGWLFADGSAVSRTTYAALFAAIGTTYGAPNDSTFNLPNLINRFARGGWNRWETGGYDSVTLSQYHLPAVALSVSGYTDFSGQHVHGFFTRDINVATSAYSDNRFAAYATNAYNYTDAAGLHQHYFSGYTSNLGSGGAFDNRPAFTTLRPIIFAGAAL